MTQLADPAADAEDARISADDDTADGDEAVAARLRDRVTVLEHEKAELERRLAEIVQLAGPQRPWWERIAGTFTQEESDYMQSYVRELREADRREACAQADAEDRAAAESEQAGSATQAEANPATAKPVASAGAA